MPQISALCPLPFSCQDYWFSSLLIMFHRLKLRGKHHCFFSAPPTVKDISIPGNTKTCSCEMKTWAPKYLVERFTYKHVGKFRLTCQIKTMTNVKRKKPVKLPVIQFALISS